MPSEIAGWLTAEVAEVAEETKGGQAMINLLLSTALAVSSAVKHSRRRRERRGFPTGRPRTGGPAVRSLTILCAF